jgi:hypothetical protein
MRAPPISLGRFYPDGGDPQAPAEVGVIIPTVMRPQIVRAVQSVYEQASAGRVQIVVGVDVMAEPATALYAALAQRPDHVSALVLTLPYSTSVRHGGVHIPTDGGSLRSILSYAANARRVAYLDDDNTWTPNHLQALLAAVEGKAWAFSHRLLIDEATGGELCVDRWDSVGPGKGRFADQGGFVDTNCLMVDKLRAATVFGRWATTGTNEPGVTADRNFFAGLRELPYGVVEEATVRYGIRNTNILHRFIRNGAVF